MIVTRALARRVLPGAMPTSRPPHAAPSKEFVDNLARIASLVKELTEEGTTGTSSLASTTSSTSTSDSEDGGVRCFGRGDEGEGVGERLSPHRYTPLASSVGPATLPLSPATRRLMLGGDGPASVLQPAFQCPYCVSRHLRAHPGAGVAAAAAAVERGKEAMAWRAPYDMLTHVDWCHMHEGISASEMEPFNEFVMDQLVARVVPASISSLSADAAPPLTPIELIVLVDLANIVLDSGSSIVTLSQSPEAVKFFTGLPVAVCLMQETFVPHNAFDIVPLFELTLLNRASDLFTLYAVSELEAGDLVCARFVSNLLLRLRTQRQRQQQQQRGAEGAGHDPCVAPVDDLTCPPIVLITKDMHQRACMTEMFPGIVFTTKTNGYSRFSILEACRRAVASDRRL